MVSRISQDPTPSMLAGVFLHVEGHEDLSVRPGCKPVPSAVVESTAPTVEQLAGSYLLVEAAEDLTVRPPRPYTDGRTHPESL
jgi:hypothetical protein